MATQRKVAEQSRFRLDWNVNKRVTSPNIIFFTHIFIDPHHQLRYVHKVK